jgi:hypothetical protein
MSGVNDHKITQFASLKAAMAAGFRRPRPHEYGGEQIDIKGRRLVRNAEIAVSRTEWSRRGFYVVRGACPHTTKRARVNGKTLSWDVFRSDQVRQRREHKVAEPNLLPLLLALWAVNRAAKRQRDAARKLHAARAFALASLAKERKKELYWLKSQALHFAILDGMLTVAGYHRFEYDHWAEVLIGDGYSFHRPCKPPPDTSSADSKMLEQIDAKPRCVGEPRLLDAKYTLEKFLDGKPTVSTYSWLKPDRERPRICIPATFDEEEDEVDDDEEC